MVILMQQTPQRDSCGSGSAKEKQLKRLFVFMRWWRKEFL